MRKSFLAILFITISVLIVSCDKKNIVSTPVAGFEVFKASSVNGSAETVQLVPISQAGDLYVGDTIVFVSKCTGDKNYIFTGDTVYNTDGSIDITRLAYQPLDVTYDAQGDRYVRTEALLLPKDGEDLVIAYGGYSDKRVLKDQGGQYYAGILPYVYQHPGSMKVVAYAVNYSDDEMDYKMNLFEQIITINIR
ncbi:MAG: hypothetical protein ACK5NK_11780 [Niabella sp.]